MLETAPATAAQSLAAEQPPRPLAGVRVLDFTHVLAGPFCTRILADLGADVVRVESSKHPDSPWKTSADKGLERPASYLITNRGKRSVAVDLKTVAGRDLATRLASVADVVAENFSAGVMDRLGLGDAHLRSLNPRLVYLSMSGYGHEGPRRDWTSMNMNLQGASGLLMVNGAEGDPPTAVSNSWNDYIAGLHGALGVLEAIRERRQTGLGRYLDLSQFECSVATLGALVVAAAANGLAPPRMGNRSERAAPQGCYRCAGQDEWCAIHVQSDQQWDALVAALGAPAWALDRRFASAAGRMEHADDIDRRLEDWTGGRDAAEVERVLRARGVPARRMRRAETLWDEPDGATVFEEMADPRQGTIRITRMPFLRDLSALATEPAPSLGADTDTVLRGWLGMDEDDVARLSEQGVLV